MKILYIYSFLPDEFLESVNIIVTISMQIIKIFIKGSFTIMYCNKKSRLAFQSGFPCLLFSYY